MREVVRIVCETTPVSGGRRELLRRVLLVLDDGEEIEVHVKDVDHHLGAAGDVGVAMLTIPALVETRHVR